MKPTMIFLILRFFIIFSVSAQDNIDKAGSVETIKDFKYLFRYQNFYIGGQPTLEELQWLRSRGVMKIVNLRSDTENIEYSESAYNEKVYSQKLGFEYYSAPISGAMDYTPEKLDAVFSSIRAKETVFIHCLTGGRATTFFMAYLIKIQGYTVNEAADVGRNMRFSLPLEMLLDTKISLEIIE